MQINVHDTDGATFNANGEVETETETEVEIETVRCDVLNRTDQYLVEIVSLVCQSEHSLTNSLAVKFPLL